MANVYGMGWYPGFDVQEALKNANFRQSMGLDGTGGEGEAFGTQLAGAIGSGFLGSGGAAGRENGSQLETQKSAAPVVVLTTVTRPAVVSLSSSVAVTTPPSVTSAPVSVSAATTALAPAASAVLARAPLAASTISEVRPPETEYDAYWSQQPPEVQQLQTIDDYADREAKAWDLTRQGFTIDYQIMVARWDPLNAMSIRKFYGYTWVPSMGQPPIPVVPGIVFPGETTYDPDAPPPGSVAVSTDFAIDRTVPAWESYNAVTVPDGRGRSAHSST